MKYLLLVVSIFGLDEGIKQRIDKKEPLGKERRVPKLPVVIEKYYNNGAALNLLAKKPKIRLGYTCMHGRTDDHIWICIKKRKYRTENRI